MSKRKCKYCKKLLINLVGESQTCLKLDIIVNMNNDYELTLAFIKNKGYSLKDVLEYEKELKSE